MFSKKILERQEELNLFFVTMTDYGKDIESIVAFAPDSIPETLSEVISEHNLTQSHIAETEKFAHATYFLNGGVEEEHKGEKFILVESRKDIKTHDLAPGMRAAEIADKTIKEIGKHVDFIFVNFANPDMVGHTAVKSATIEAIETTDRELGKVVEKALDEKYDIIISSDHGNAEAPDTAHTINPVPFIYIGDGNKKVADGSLSDIAPTILDLLDIKKPSPMTGKVLLS
jgi:2,3-bisphosphoglycerate-independent phosphoglycerate mutase